MNKKIYQLLAIFLIVSCSSKIESQMADDKISIKTSTEYSDSVNDFKDSIESVTGEEFNFHKMETRYIEYDLSNLENSINQNNLNRIITISQKENKTNYSFKIDVDNYEDLSTIFPEMKNEKVSVYLAKYNMDESEEDYLDMIDFVFGEEAREDLKDSSVALSFLKNEDEIFSDVKGCEIVDDTIEVDFRLLNFLLLKEPIGFSFSVEGKEI